MKFVIKHEIRGRVRVHFYQEEMNARRADLLRYYLCTLPGVKVVRVYERTTDVVVVYEGSRGEILEGIQRFSYDNGWIQELMPKDSGRVLNREYKEKLVQKVMAWAFIKSFPPPSALAVYTAVRSIQCLLKGIRCLPKGGLEVEALNVTVIVMSVLRRGFGTAGSVMFPLGIGEPLEGWTHRKSVSDLARSMFLNISRVWQKVDGAEVLVPVPKVREGDLAMVHMGSVIPLNGMVTSGDAMVNQVSITRESAPVRKGEGPYVYAGTTVKGREIILRARKATGDTRFERTTTMIEGSEQLKPMVGDRVAILADASVPWSLDGTALTQLLTRNVTEALSILMASFSCVLKLTTPLLMLSVMWEAGSYHITVKGGKYMEAVAAAHTIVFGKTGTLTKARPQMADVVVFSGMRKDELLRITACPEERFPHSMVDAVVYEAAERRLVHKKIHSRVDYIVARGIAIYVDHKRVVIGSYYFVSEDKGCRIPEDKKEAFDRLPVEYSYPYLAIGGSLATVICIKDPLRDKTGGVVTAFHRQGTTKIVIMAGDSERTVAAIAGRVGMDEYYLEVLPEDKTRFTDEGRKKGRRAIMIGDGIDGSPVPLAADAGIAISEGAEIAREVTDITISEDSLLQLVALRVINRRLMNRIDRNYRFVIGFNLGLILLGVGGVIIPATSAMLRNTSTLAIGLKGMTNPLD